MKVTYLKEGILSIALFSLSANENKGVIARAKIVILDHEIEAMCWRWQNKKLEDAWVSGSQVSFFVLDCYAQIFHGRKINS